MNDEPNDTPCFITRYRSSSTCTPAPDGNCTSVQEAITSRTHFVNQHNNFKGRHYLLADQAVLFLVVGLAIWELYLLIHARCCALMAPMRPGTQ